MEPEKDEIREGALTAIAQAQATLEQRGECYNQFKVDDYMLKVPGEADNLNGYMQMVHLKTLRTFSCLQSQQREQALDSLVDLINYAAFLHARVSQDVQALASLPEPPFKGVEYVSGLGWRMLTEHVPVGEGMTEMFSLFCTPSDDADNYRHINDPVLYGDEVTVRQDATGYTTRVKFRWRSNLPPESFIPCLRASAMTRGWKKGDTLTKDQAVKDMGDYIVAHTLGQFQIYDELKEGEGDTKLRKMVVNLCQYKGNFGKKFLRILDTDTGYVQNVLYAWDLDELNAHHSRGTYPPGFDETLRGVKWS